MNDEPEFDEWFDVITPLNILRWASVVFVICLYVLVIVSIVLALFGAF